MDDHDLILAEEFLLLALDDEKGTYQLWNGADPALAGALLLDLAAAGAVHVTDGKLAAAPDARLEHPLLNDAHGAIAASTSHATHRARRPRGRPARAVARRAAVRAPAHATGGAADRAADALRPDAQARRPGAPQGDAVQAEVMTTILTTTVAAGAATAASGN